jgi:hypothetical protein
MKGKKDCSGVASYVKGALSGMISAVAILYTLNISGLIVVSSMGSFSLVPLLQWCYENLGLSVIPFSLIAAGYVFYLKKLVRLLEANNASSRDICAAEEKIDLLMNIFFGIGVIWTAIGMRNALLSALGNMDAEIAAQKGAFSILTQLVEGGILLSLSTTIVGGIGGYFMRMVKAWTAGPKLNAFFDAQLTAQNQDVLTRLDRIALLLEDNIQGDAP